MFIFLGILLGLVAIVHFFAGLIIPKSRTVIDHQWSDEHGKYENVEKTTNTDLPAIIWNWKIPIAVLILGIIMMAIPFLLFFASPGYQYFLVYPNGKRDAVMNEGIKWRGLAKITEWDKWIDIKVVDELTDGDKLADIEGVMKPIPLRFIDQVTAKGKISARFRLPSDKEKFIAVAIEFRSLENLIQTTLIPTVKETMSNTGYMFAAQDYISGEAQNFRTTYEEQLSNGSYVVKKITVRDTTWDNISHTGDQRRIKSIKTNYFVRKVLDKNGRPKIIPNEITKNDIIVSQVIVDDIMLDTAFQKRLEKQRDESAKRQLEQQKIKTAKDARERIIAEGERDKAQERVNQELAQVKTLINIETDLKEEETNKKLAAIKLETERINAKKIKVAADADAYEIRQKVNAGITPEVRLKMELDAKVRMMAELAKTKWPGTYISGGSKGGDPINALISAAMAKQLNSK